MCDMNWLDVRKSLRTLMCLHIILPRIARSEGSNEDPVNVVTIPAITLSNVDYAQNLRINNFVYLRFVAVGNSFFFSLD